jgi:DNA polymerase-3 subunit gamma/tau
LTPPEVGASELVPDNWARLVEQLGLLGMVYNIASNCQLVAVEGDTLRFVLDEGNASLFNDGHSDKIRLALENYFDRPLSVAIEVGSPPGETPAMQRARAARERQAEAVAEIERDQRLQQLLAQFDGKLDPGSIAPMDS